MMVGSLAALLAAIAVDCALARLPIGQTIGFQVHSWNDEREWAAAR